MTKPVKKEAKTLGGAWEVGSLGNERPKQPAGGQDPGQKSTVEIPKRAKTEKLSPLNIEAIQRLRRGGSSFADIEAFTGFGHSTIARYCEGIEPMEKYSPKPIGATGQTALPSGQTTSQPQPAKTDEQIAQ